MGMEPIPEVDESLIDAESPRISELKTLHLKECNEIAKHFLEEHEKNVALQKTIEELQQQNNVLNEKMENMSSREGNDSGCEDRDYMNECYLLECEKNSQLGQDVESLRCTVDELRAVVQQVQGKANEEYLLDNLKLRRKLGEQSTELHQLQEALKEKEKREKNLEMKVSDLEECVNKWRKKQEKSSRKLTERSVKMRELVEEVESLKIINSKRRRVYEVKSCNQITKSRESRSLNYRGSEILLKEEKSCQGLTLTNDDNLPIPPISVKNNSKDDNQNKNKVKTGPSASKSEIYIKSVIPPILGMSKSYVKLANRKSGPNKRNSE